MEKDRDTNFQEHSIFLSEIAENILNGNHQVFSIPGVSEIIALYLLVPYITNTQLDSGMPSKMPKLDLSEKFTDEITLKDLRDAICHSFVSVEESTEIKKGRIIVDDRAQMNRSKHDKKTSKTEAGCINIDSARIKLIELHKKVINSIESNKCT